MCNPIKYSTFCGIPFDTRNSFLHALFSVEKEQQVIHSSDNKIF